MTYSCNNNNEIPKFNNCEEAKEKAKLDLQNGKLIYFFGSFGVQQPLAKKLKQFKEIEVIEVEGVLGSYDCYNNITYKRLQEKFGNDFFNKLIE